MRHLGNLFSWPTLAWIGMGFIPVNADPATGPGSTQQASYRNTIAQESLRKDADQIQAALGQLIAEINLNGLDSGNLALLNDASQHLSGMSHDDMQKVINLLQSASLSNEEAKQGQALLGAYQGQQELVLKLKKLANFLAAQRAGDQLVNELAALITRQSANIRQTTALSNGGHAPNQLTDAEKTTYSVAASEQTSIGGQIDLLSSNLASMAQTPAPSEEPDPAAKAVLDAMTNSPLKDTSHLATQLTNTGQFPAAAEKQQAVKQELVDLLKAAADNTDAATRLDQAMNQIEQAQADQRDVTDQTRTSRTDAATLAQRQQDVSDRTEATKALLASLNPAAATLLSSAQTHMAQSADALTKTQQTPATSPAANPAKQDALARQDDAARALHNADQMLAQQRADIEKAQDQSPSDQMAQLQKAQEEIKQAQAAQPVNAQQAAQAASQAQQDAVAQAPVAAAKLADAAAQLQGRPSTNQPNQPAQPANPSGQPDAAAIQKDLAEAAQDIQKKQDALAQAAQDDQALTQAAQAAAQAAQNAAEADKGLQGQSGKSGPDIAHQLGQAQAQANQAAQSGSAAVPGEAKAALAAAADALKGSAMKMAQSDRPGAHAQAQQAMAALQMAQSSLQQAMAQALQQAMAQNRNGRKETRADPTQALGNETKGLLKGGDGRAVGQGSALVVGSLSPKDRDTITQYQAEKSPAEYAPLVQQYLKNLADPSDAH